MKLFKLIVIVVICVSITFAQNYKIVDTAQEKCFNDSVEMTPPSIGEPFYGQDAQFDGNQPSYTISNDGLTVYDNVTGLTWMRDPDLNGDNIINTDDKMNYSDGQNYPATLNSQNYGGYSDWRVPTIKELYSLMDFSGRDQMSDNTSNAIPFIDADFFLFAYGDTDAGERAIDSQWLTSTIYVDYVMNNQQAMFGVNFADGRIKGYPAGSGGMEKTFYVRLCRGNTYYGINDFADNSDGTITDKATGLMWTQDDNQEGINWSDALAYAQSKNDDNYLGYNDWRLPNAKELQSIVDYTRSPSTTNSATIDPLFSATQITNEAGESDFPWYWTNTTHARDGGVAESAAYVAFGRGLGSMDDVNVIDVHGAGCQRSDPKDGDADDYPTWGGGSQGDVRRVFNYVRLVRDASVTVGVNDGDSILSSFQLNQNYPNPFNPSTTIKFSIPNEYTVKLEIFNIGGQLVETLVDEKLAMGSYNIVWNASNVPSGSYIYKLSGNGFLQKKQMTVIK